MNSARRNESKPWGYKRLRKWLRERARRAVKRRMRGESYRQWIERNLQDSELGALIDVVQGTFTVIMVWSVIHQNWQKPNSTRPGAYHNIDLANVVIICLGYVLRCVLFCFVGMTTRPN